MQSLSGGAVQGSMTDLFSNNSYGYTTFPRELTRVIDVPMGRPLPSSASGCPYSTEKLEVDRIALETSGLDPSTFHHKEYFIPWYFGTCNWIGFANVGCRHPLLTDRSRSGNCWSFLRTSWPSIRTHELGHNLGLMHASLGTDEYGDETSVMSNHAYWSGFSAADREHLGWLPDEHIYDYSPLWDMPVDVRLHALHLPPQHQQYAAARIRCSTCDIYGVGYSFVFVSFITPSSYFADLPARFHNKVFVRLQKAHAQGRPYTGRGTVRMAHLSQGESYTLQSGHTIKVCHIQGGTAAVAISSQTSSVSREELCTKGVYPPLPPMPPPTPGPPQGDICTNVCKANRERYASE